MGRILAVCISEKKGTVKHDIASCNVIKDFGLEGDAHAGSERQVSLLSSERVEEFKKKTGGKVRINPGTFGENLLVSGFDPAMLPIGTRFVSGEVILELTQIGKKCHSGCEISKLTGECIMPSSGVFARVLRGGRISAGDEITVKSCFKAALITSSDRAFTGEYEDKSGPVMKDILETNGYEVIKTVLLPDDEERMYEELVSITDNEGPDVIFTTGGTGFSEKDRTPEATMRAAEKNAPGIAEAVRAYSMKITPKAMLSRAVSVIRKKTVIINLPGSPKAVKECLYFLLPVLEHGIMILRGEADG